MNRTRFVRIALIVGVAVIVVYAGIAGYVYYRLKVNFQDVILKQKETILREDLVLMRAGLKQYAHDRGRPPQSLTDLVKADYLSEIPRDPITGKPEWQVTHGHYGSSALNPARGIIDVHSWSSQKSSTGTPYSQW